MLETEAFATWALVDSVTGTAVPLLCGLLRAEDGFTRMQAQAALLSIRLLRRPWKSLPPVSPAWQGWVPCQYSGQTRAHPGNTSGESRARRSGSARGYDCSPASQRSRHHAWSNNTITEALTLCVPLLVGPFSSDQFDNAADVERAGVGEVFAPNTATPMELRARTIRMLGAEGVHRRAASLGATLRAQPGPELAARMIAAM